MQNPEHSTNPEPQDSWTDEEQRQLLEANLSAQGPILSPLINNPDLITDTAEVDAIFKYALLVGMAAEETLKEQMRRHPEERVWHRLDQFLLRKIPKVFEQNPELERKYGISAEDVSLSYYTAIQQAKQFKGMYDDEMAVYKRAQNLLDGKEPSEEDALDALYKEFVHESHAQYQHMRQLLNKYGLSRSTPFHLHDDEVQRLETSTQDELRQAHLDLLDLRLRYSAMYNWHHKVHFEVLTSDITREYVTALIDEFGVLPTFSNSLEVMQDAMVNLRIQNPEHTKKISNSTIRLSEPIPTNLPGDLGIYVSYTNTGDESTSKFCIQLSNPKY